MECDHLYDKGKCVYCSKKSKPRTLRPPICKTGEHEYECHLVERVDYLAFDWVCNICGLNFSEE